MFILACVQLGSFEFQIQYNPSFSGSVGGEMRAHRLSGFIQFVFVPLSNLLSVVFFNVAAFCKSHKYIYIYGFWATLVQLASIRKVFCGLICPTPFVSCC